MPDPAEVTPAPVPATKGRKTPSKTPKKERELRTPAHGRGQLMTGGTNRGGPGRPPNSYKVWLEASLTHPTAKAQVTKVLRNNNHPAYAAVLRSTQLHVLGVPGKAQEVPPDENIHVSVDL